MYVPACAYKSLQTEEVLPQLMLLHLMSMATLLCHHFRLQTLLLCHP